MNETLPHNPEDEKLAIAAMLLDTSLVPFVLSLFSLQDFYRPELRQIFRAVCSLDERGSEADVHSIWNELRATEDSPAISSLADFARLTYGVHLASKSELERAAKRIKETSRLRHCARVYSEAIQRVLAGEYTASQIAGYVEDETTRLRDISETHFRSMERISTDVEETLSRYFRNISDSIPTGIKELDENLHGGGIGKTDLVIIAAQTSRGKTSLALDIAGNMARSGHPVAFLSREMQDVKLAIRMLSSESGVARWKIRAGLYKSDFDSLIESLSSLKELPIHIDSRTSTLNELRRRVRDLVRTDKCKALFVDYLQLLKTGEKHGNRNLEVSEISRFLKDLTLEFSIPVIALSQLSRNSARENREPELEDLRDSGQLEQDADTVLFLFGDKPEEGAIYREVFVKAAKQREGKLFRVPLTFNGELITFRAGRVIQSYTDAEEAAYLRSM